MPEHSTERDKAEARFKKAQKASQEAKEAWALYESEAKAVRERTARLKALRLAKEAADAKQPTDAKPVAAKKHTADAKPVPVKKPVPAKKKLSPARSMGSSAA